MNWKKIFLFDLGRLIPGRKPGDHSIPDWDRLWFVQIRRFLGELRPSTVFRRTPVKDRSYAPGAYYKVISPGRWPGPRYFRVESWRRELLDVVDQLAALTRTNASLTEGLEAAAREDNRQNKQIFGFRARYAVQVLCLMLIVFIALVVLPGAAIIGIGELFEAAIYTLLPCIAFLVLTAKPGRKEAVFLRLRDSLASGYSLSESMAKMPRFFPKFYVDMVRAGEYSGSLAETLDELGEDTLQSITLGRNVRHHFWYLGIVFSLHCLILSFLAVKVFPVLVEIHADLDSNIPSRTPFFMIKNFLTRIDPELPNLVVQLLLAAPVLILITGWLVRRNRRRLFSRFSVALLSPLPWMRGLMARWNLVTISVMLEKFLKAGVPLPEALGYIETADIHVVYRRAVRHIRKRVEQGESFSAACAGASGLAQIPSSFQGYIGTGEQAECLPDSLGQIAAFYKTYVDKNLKILADLVMPIGVLCIGAITLAIELTAFMMIVGMSDAILNSI